MNGQEKSKEKRLEEKEKLEAETQRSLATAEMKQAHILIENLEKSRKRLPLLSVCHRIVKHVESNLSAIEFTFSILKIRKHDFKITDDSVVLAYVENALKGYESIRYDLQKALDMIEADFDRLFPKIEVNLESAKLTHTKLIIMCEQMTDMVNYCERMIG